MNWRQTLARINLEKQDKSLRKYVLRVIETTVCFKHLRYIYVYMSAQCYRILASKLYLRAYGYAELLISLLSLISVFWIAAA